MNRSPNNCTNMCPNMYPNMQKNYPNHFAKPEMVPESTDYGFDKLSTMSRKQLLEYINEVSFGLYDLLLYLDTHPACEEGSKLFRKLSAKRNRAVIVYTERFTPLTIDTISDSDCENWEWVNSPWPWEGGC